MSKLAIILTVFAGITLAGCASQYTQSAQEKRDNEFNAAVKKCDDLSVPERKECIYDARQKYGKS